MGTIKINIMSIIAVIITVVCFVAVVLLNVPTHLTTVYSNTFMAFLIISIICAIAVLIVTCADIESLTGKTFLVYALVAVFLLIAIGYFGHQLDVLNVKTGDLNPVEHYAAMALAVVGFFAAVTGAAAPFVCKASSS